MTDLRDIYVAAGGKSNGDGSVTMFSHEYQTFDIVLKVALEAFEASVDGDSVSLRVLSQDPRIGEDQRLKWPEALIDLPVDCIRLLPDNQEVDMKSEEM